VSQVMIQLSQTDVVSGVRKENPSSTTGIYMQQLELVVNKPIVLVIQS